jgi:hypothetical protein
MAWDGRAYLIHFESMPHRFLFSFVIMDLSFSIASLRESVFPFIYSDSSYSGISQTTLTSCFPYIGRYVPSFSFNIFNLPFPSCKFFSTIP